MQVFFGKAEAGVIRLNEDESKHLSRVLRKVEGDQVYASDGEGNWYDCEVQLSDKHQSVLAVRSTRFTENKPLVSLYIAPTKNIARMEWLLEKAVELGLSDIHFMLCDNSERKKLRIDRMEKVALSAMKQSQGVYLPQIHDLTSFDQVLENIEAEKSFLAHCYPELHRETFIDQVKVNHAINLLIGPEGDFSRLEVNKATDKGIRCIHLGQSRLRTETAALYGLSIVKSVTEK